MCKKIEEILLMIKNKIKKDYQKEYRKNITKEQKQKYKKI